MQGHDVRARQQVVEVTCRRGVAKRQFGFDVVVDHVHAQPFGQHADLGADVAVADDAERLAAHLEAAIGGLGPATAVAFGIAFGHAPHQQDRLGDHQFRDTAGVGIGGVEHRHGAFVRLVEIDLVGADAEAADRQQAARLRNRLGVQLGARTQAHDVRVGDGLEQLVAWQRLVVVFDPRVSGVAENLDGTLVDAFKQDDLDVLFRERGFHVGNAQLCRDGGC